MTFSLELASLLHYYINYSRKHFIVEAHGVLKTGTCTIKLLAAVIYTVGYKVRSFYPSLIFADKARSLPLEWPCLQILGKSGSEWEWQTL